MIKRFLLIAFFISLISCSANNHNILSQPTIGAGNATEIGEGECLPPLETFSFLPTGGEKPGPQPISTQTLPAKDWMPVIAVPGGRPVNGDELAEISMKTSQFHDGKNQIWVWVGTAPDPKYFRYDIEGNEWHEIEISDRDLYKSGKPTLFLDKNNSVWAARTTALGFNLNNNTPVLSMFNEKLQKFDTTLNIKDFLDLLDSSRLKGVGIATLQTDGAGNLWFLLQIQMDSQGSQYALYRFTPSTNQLEHRLPNLKYDSQNSGSFIITPTDILFLLDEKNNSIIRYNPSNGEMKMIRIPDQVVNNTNGPIQGLEYSGSNLFLDSQQRLWVSDRGWLDLSPEGDWHIVIRSPLFIGYVKGSSLWIWEHPYFLNESADGRIWYVGYNRGTGWVDPEKGNWCLFTNYTSNISKDNNGNLWMIANGKLYKHTIIP